MRLERKLNDILSYLDSQSQVQLSIKNLTKEGSKVFCFSVSGNFCGIELSGFGQSYDKDKSFFIAVMELLERFIVNKFKVKSKTSKGLFKKSVYNYYNLNSTNGVAVHFEHKQAVSNALDELIERHIVLKSLAENLIPMKLNFSVDSFQKHTKYPLDFYVWQGPYKRNIVIVRSKYKEHTIYGFGCNKNLNSALNKSFLELYPRLSLFDDFADSKRPFINSNEHTLFHWEGNTNWTDGFFEKSKEVIKKPKIDVDVKRSELIIKDFMLCRDLEKIGIKATAVKCLRFQQLFTGSWDSSKINMSAISAECLPPEVHMIG